MPFLETLEALGALGSGLASLFGGGEPPTVLKPQSPQPLPSPDLQQLGIQLGPPAPMPEANLFAATAKEDAADVARALTMQQPPIPSPGGGPGLAYGYIDGQFQPFHAAGPSPAPPQSSLAGFFARKEVEVPNGSISAYEDKQRSQQDVLDAVRPAPVIEQEEDVLSLARKAKPAPKKQEKSWGVQGTIPSSAPSKAAGAAQVASSAASVAREVSSPAKAAAGAATAAGSGSDKFLGLSGGQWQGIGAATGILAQLFKSEPAQVLQIQQRSQQGPPPVALSSIPMPRN